jgi:hypothetical protein
MRRVHDGCGEQVEVGHQARDLVEADAVTNVP